MQLKDLNRGDEIQVFGINYIVVELPAPLRQPDKVALFYKNCNDDDESGKYARIDFMNASLRVGKVERLKTQVPRFSYVVVL